MIDVKKMELGDSVFWLDSDGDIIEHTYIGNIGRVGMLSGELTPRGINPNGYPTGHFPIIDKNIGNKISEMAEKNETYNPYPICFVDIKNLYKTKYEAENALYEL